MFYVNFTDRSLDKVLTQPTSWLYRDAACDAAQVIANDLNQLVEVSDQHGGHVAFIDTNNFLMGETT